MKPDKVLTVVIEPGKIQFNLNWFYFFLCR